MKKNYLITAPITLLLLIVASCEEPPAPPGSIEFVNWEVFNLATDYFNPPATATAFITFRIYFNEKNLSGKDFKSIKVRSSQRDIPWTFDSRNNLGDRYKTEGDYLDLPFLFNRSQIHQIYIGRYTFDITFANGSAIQGMVLVPVPGSILLGGKKMAFTEDYRPPENPPDGYVPLPKRGAIDSAVLVGDVLTLKFRINDRLVFNGRLFFYDLKNRYIGRSDYFKKKTAILNGGRALTNDGTVNTVVVKNADFVLAPGKTIRDVAKCVIQLTDGDQYDSATLPNLVRFHASSISSRFPITKQ